METTTTTTTTSQYSSLKHFIENLPKAESHVHLEGTLEPEMRVFLAKRNGLLNENDGQDSLERFLKQASRVLQTEQDYYDLTLQYLLTVYDEHVLRTEIIMNAPTTRVSLKTSVHGIHRAMQYCRDEYGMSVALILCLSQHLSQQEALATLQEAGEWKEYIAGVELNNNDPLEFKQLCERARELGFRIVLARAPGEESLPAPYKVYHHDDLHVHLFHNGSVEDDALVQRLALHKLPLMLCPLGLDSLNTYPLRERMDAGVLVTITSNHPAYFGGYLNANYEACAKAFNLDRVDLCQLAKNSFQASFATPKEKQEWMTMVDEYVDTYDAVYSEIGNVAAVNGD